MCSGKHLSSSVASTSAEQLQKEMHTIGVNAVLDFLKNVCFSGTRAKEGSGECKEP